MESSKQIQNTNGAGNGHGPSATASATFRASELQVHGKSTHDTNTRLNSQDIESHTACTDSMITVKWTAQHGWEKPQLIPYGPISLMPTASALQYATQCFEGMKVYRGYDDKLRLFRPELNCHRMLNSVRRISLPPFHPHELLELIRRLCAVDGAKWLPRDRPGSCLYLRPTMIGSDASLGFDVPQEATLYIFIAVGLSLKNMQTATDETLSLVASDGSCVRAWPGGTGSAKIGGNYGPAMLLHGQARKQGYDQVLWLLGPQQQITEAGSSNIFFIWRNLAGTLEMVTPSLDDQTILPGVTRQSILDLARARMGSSSCSDFCVSSIIVPLAVSERCITMAEVTKAVEDGRMLCAFTSGTANFVMPVASIDFGDRRLAISQKYVGYVEHFRRWLAAIMYGEEDHEWGNVIDES